MPVGVLVNNLSVLFGGLIGAVLATRLPERLRENLPRACGMIALAIGIISIGQVQNLSAVALAFISGTLAGELLKLDDRLGNLVQKLGSRVKLGSAGGDSDRTLEFLGVLVLFCASGTGIFGSLNEGFSGDNSVLLTKAVLDFFTAMVFAASLGYIVALVALPQCAIQLLLFFSAALLMPVLTPQIIADFKACGGLITLGIGLNILRITKLKATNFLPSLILIVPMCMLWELII